MAKKLLSELRLENRIQIHLIIFKLHITQSIARTRISKKITVDRKGIIVKMSDDSKILRI